MLNRDNLPKDELGRFGIPLLLQFTDAHHYPDLGELAADILENLSKHPVIYISHDPH